MIGQGTWLSLHMSVYKHHDWSTNTNIATYINIMVLTLHRLQGKKTIVYKHLTTLFYYRVLEHFSHIYTLFTNYIYLKFKVVVFCE